jgi:hypothetical protein
MAEFIDVAVDYSTLPLELYDALLTNQSVFIPPLCLSYLLLYTVALATLYLELTTVQQLDARLASGGSETAMDYFC